ncbi:MAG: hypothetical protein ACI88H_000763 [Cocleimonas sp.]|jgi:hypothetical protein
MNFNLETLTIRKPLWIALSDLFLDTELQEHDLAFIAKKMKESGYSLEEIHDILMVEVLPVCIANLYSVAAEWAGFNENWVVKTIISARRPNRLRQWINHRSFWMIKNQWEEVVKLYQQL